MTATNDDTRQAWPDGESPVRRQADTGSDDALIIDIGGFEGPLDLLLELARHQKIDLSRLSMLALAEQFLAFIDSARAKRLELAADYLVMAAWLAFLKSRLLLPATSDEDEPAGDDLAQRLAFRLQRLQVMRDAAAQLMARNRLGRDVFARGEPEPLRVETQLEYSNNLVDLLKAYAERRRQKLRHQTYIVRKIKVWLIKDARVVLERLIGQMDDWSRLDDWLVQYFAGEESHASVIASSFTASLELAREGSIEIRQERAFEPIFLRRRRAAA